jgi:O-methyltransferase
MHRLLSNYPIISDQVDKKELDVILQLCEKSLTQTTDGGVVELGCYVGTTALFLQRLLCGQRQLYIYDSFAGLPKKVGQDSSSVGAAFVEGELFASKKALIENFKKANLPLPRIIKGWFEELEPNQLPDKICFAYLDGDFYTSILSSLKLVWPKLVTGAIVVIDDYQSEHLPGVKKALDVWAQDHKFSLKTQSSLAIVQKQ